MNTTKLLLALGTGLLAATALTQPYAVDWHKLAGGGGTSSAGPYQVSGTLGQPDAGAILTNGSYAVTGGFWSPFAVQTAGAPWLRIFLTTTNTAVVAWPAPSADYVLQESPTLESTPWINTTNMVSVVAGENQVIVPRSAGTHFYRLFRP